MFGNLDPFQALSALNAITDVDKISGKFNQIIGQIPNNNKRIYYCQRCLNHGQLEPRKNHKSECRFASCTCQKCILVEKRRVLNSQLHELEDTILLSSSTAAASDSSDSKHDFIQHRSRTLTNSSDMTSITEEGEEDGEKDEEVLKNILKLPLVSNNSSVITTINDSLIMDYNNDYFGNDLPEHGRIKGVSFCYNLLIIIIG
uniref:DM domain-containing protein n=1 Tax=Panagrolaimus superbus TaxID=310955 RepID=A0A914YZR0_9BILA